MRAAIATSCVLFLAALPAAAANHSVEVRDDFFSPATLTIQEGDSVTWTNFGNMPHNVRANDGSFRCANGCDGQGGNGTASAAQWSFTLTFDDPGTIPYFCEVHGTPTAGMRGTVIVEGSGEPPPGTPGDAHVALIGVAGSVAGGFGSFFQTSVRLFNPGSDAITVGGSFMKAGADNTAAPEQVVTLAPREVKTFEDVVGGLFGSDGLGALRFHSDDSFEVTARVASTSICQSPTGGFSGVLLAGFDPGGAIPRGVLLHLEWTPGNRSNIGFANPNDTAVNVTATLYGASGVAMGSTFSTTIAPRGALSPINIRDTFGVPNLDAESLYVTFEASQPILAYGTLVDNVTNDPTFTPARSLPAGFDPARPPRY
ncbi:MAG: plastocyanin/azurin family copper-binding protein [Thermoanaerobaculia bacterium]